MEKMNLRSNTLEYCVKFGETDRAGIVYYPNYYKWFDMATHAFFKSIHLPMKKLEVTDQIIIPLLEAHCQFERPVTDDDELTIVTTVAEVNNKTIKLTHEIFCDGIRTSHGYEIRGWVKKSEDRIAAVPIPDEIKGLLVSNEPVCP